MASYTVEWKRAAVKELRALPKEVIERILKAVGELATNPYPVGVRKLVAAELHIVFAKEIIESSILWLHLL